MPVLVEFVQSRNTQPLIGDGIDTVGDGVAVVYRIGIAGYVVDVVGIVNARVRARACERAGHIIDVPPARVAVDHGTHGPGSGDERYIDDAGAVAARITVAGIDVPHVRAAFGHVEFRFVRDVTQHTRLGAGAEQRALRPFEHFDALQIGGIDVEVAAGHLPRLLVEIDRYVGKAADDARTL